MEFLLRTFFILLNISFFCSHIVSATNQVVPVTIVVAYCKNPLNWLTRSIQELHKENPQFQVVHVAIFSKCNNAIIGAPPGISTVTILPNVGRCDHTYLHFITEMKLKTGLVLFLKDTHHAHWQLKVKDLSKNEFEGITSIRKFGQMLEIAASPAQFACRQHIETSLTGISNIVITKVLLRWSRKDYVHDKYNYSSAADGKSPVVFGIDNRFENWVNRCNVPISNPLTTVCYGGIFAVNVERIRSIDPTSWLKMRESMSRGDNIQEGHFMERSWSGILNNQSMGKTATKVYCLKRDVCGYTGNIITDPRLLKTNHICGTSFHRFWKVTKSINYCTVKPAHLLNTEKSKKEEIVVE